MLISRGKRGVQVLAADIVKIDVDALRGCGTKFVEKVSFSFVVDDSIRSELANPSAFSCSSRGGDDGQASCFR